MGLFDSIFGKKRDPNIVTKEVVDHAKAPVGNALSAYLKGQIGKGVDPYTGPLAPDIDPELNNRYSEFIGLNSRDFFDKNVRGPATRRYTEDVLPVLREGYAGSLRGSGRFRSEEDSLNRFSSDLAGLEADVALQLPESQFRVATNFFAMRDLGIQRGIEKYIRELPQNNPALQQALGFLSQGTSSGTTILSGLDPGKATSGFGDFLTLLVKGASTAASYSAAAG